MIRWNAIWGLIRAIVASLVAIVDQHYRSRFKSSPCYECHSMLGTILLAVFDEYRIEYPPSEANALSDVIAVSPRTNVQMNFAGIGHHYVGNSGLRAILVG